MSHSGVSISHFPVLIRLPDFSELIRRRINFLFSCFDTPVEFFWIDPEAYHFSIFLF